MVQALVINIIKSRFVHFQEVLINRHSQILELYIPAQVWFNLPSNVNSVDIFLTLSTIQKFQQPIKIFKT